VSFFTKWLDAWSTRNHELRRIADALERIAPEPGEAVTLTPEEQVSYVDEEKIAQQELAEEMGEAERWLREHPEQEEDRGEGVFRESD
jgi:hypothetical protein